MNTSTEELGLMANEYRDENGNIFTQVTASCKCGRGGWLRLPKHIDISALIQQEQLKLIERIEGEVVGEDVINESNVEKYGREKPEAGLVHIHQDSLRRHQRKLLDQLKAEIKGE